MKLHELIETLQELEKEHGPDIEVYLSNDMNEPRAKPIHAFQSYTYHLGDFISIQKM